MRDEQVRHKRATKDGGMDTKHLCWVCNGLGCMDCEGSDKMTLREKQSQFVHMIGLLIQFAYLKGYELTFGDCFRAESCTHGHPMSLHRQRLAVDFNVFKNGVYLDKTRQLSELGKFWKEIGGTWGGDFGDGNHFSLEHGGMK